ncbi:hypothetical protein ACOI1C_11875 [Bacillus sp. DJP31]|uniref:hypothetical protein n=1 Tax=Bacillus sp. DJP31 TaxID=3409789 RepID=UPI003BB63736
MKNSIGADPCVTVLNLIELPKEAGYLIPILVEDQEIAEALATILTLQKDLGNLTIFVAVLSQGQLVSPIGSNLTPEDIVKLYTTAFETNRFFKSVVAQEVFLGDVSVFPVFKKSVIQFFNDDLSDLFRHFNAVAAEVFRDVLRGEINNIIINPSTTDKK